MRRADAEERIIVQPLCFATITSFKKIGKADIQLADPARAAIKHKALTGKSLIKRLDSLWDSGEDISGQKGYQHATNIYTQNRGIEKQLSMQRKERRRAAENIERSSVPKCKDLRG